MSFCTEVAFLMAGENCEQLTREETVAKYVFFSKSVFTPVTPLPSDLAANDVSKNDTIAALIDAQATAGAHKITMTGLIKNLAIGAPTYTTIPSADALVDRQVATGQSITFIDDAAYDLDAALTITMSSANNLTNWLNKDMALRKQFMERINHYAIQKNSGSYYVGYTTTNGDLYLYIDENGNPESLTVKCSRIQEGSKPVLQNAYTYEIVGNRDFHSWVVPYTSLKIATTAAPTVPLSILYK